MKLRAIFGICLLAVSAQGATNWATSAQSSVATALSAAARGDTVIIEQGTATWSSGVTLTKGVSLMTTNRLAVKITTSGGIEAITISPDATALSNGELFRVDGLWIDGGASSLSLVGVNGAAVSGTKPFTNLAIGNCVFTNNSGTTSGNGAISTHGQCRGVIYSNIFDRCNVCLKNMGNDDTTEWSNGHFPITPGSADNLYFENNTIQFSSSSAVSDPGWMETGQGQRICCRYNHWDLGNATHNQELWDIHGAQNWPGGETGTMLAEYYGNTVVNSTCYRWINHRGSIGIFFNNIITSSSGGLGINANQYVGCVAATGVPSEEITNTYCFNNTINGTQALMGIGDGANCSLAENRNFFNYNASFNSTVGVGTGTGSPPGSPAKDVGWWQATTATPTTTASVIQAGTLSIGRPANTWATFFQPFTYPHPLITSLEGGGGDTTPPTVTSATVNAAGTSLTLVLSETSSIGAGGNGGLTISMSGGAVTLTWSSGFVWTTSRTILTGETGTHSYTQPGNGIEDTAGNDLVTYSGATVTNNSTASGGGGVSSTNTASMTGAVRLTGGARIGQ